MGKLNFIQVGAGPNGLIQAIKILEKHQGKIDFAIYEKRPLEDLDKLTALLFLKKSSIDLLPPEVIDELLTPDPITGKPMGYRQIDSFFKFEVIPLYIADLQRVLIKYLRNTYHVEVQRHHELVDLEKSNEDLFAVFRVSETGQTRKIKYDLCTLSLGANASKVFTDKARRKQCNIDLNYQLFHQTPVLTARFPLKHHYAEITSSTDIVDQSKPLMQVFPFDAEQTYMGLMVTPHLVGFLATVPWNEVAAYKSDESRRIARIKSILSGVQNACPKILDAMSEQPVSTDLIFAEKSLSNRIIADYHVMVTGDSLVVSPWIYGNELNHAITHMLKVYLRSVDKIVEADQSHVMSQALHEYDRDALLKVTHEQHYQFNLLVDPYGHTRTPEGDSVPLIPMAKPRLMPAGIAANLPSENASCLSLPPVAKPYLTYLSIKINNAGNQLLRGVRRPFTDTVSPESTTLHSKANTL